MKRLISCVLTLGTLILVQLQVGITAKALPALDYSYSSVSLEESIAQPIPMLSSLKQISANQIEISYDKDVDVSKGVKATNYWVQDTVNLSPKGIATLGKNEKVNASNSLTDSLVKIQPKDGSSRTFILTFNKNITKGSEYKLIICYVTAPGAAPYSGDNGMMTFVGK